MSNLKEEDDKCSKDGRELNTAQIEVFGANFGRFLALLAGSIRKVSSIPLLSESNSFTLLRRKLHIFLIRGVKAGGNAHMSG